jgi:hypothetical protein
VAIKWQSELQVIPLLVKLLSSEDLITCWNAAAYTYNEDLLSHTGLNMSKQELKASLYVEGKKPSVAVPRNKTIQGIL